jgi:NAD(P)-dependent dehydrogenase (short-subunit alcohol dehydrogenase family)
MKDSVPGFPTHPPLQIPIPNPEGVPIPLVSDVIPNAEPAPDGMNAVAVDLPLALVTGAALRIGKAVALELASQGFAIGLHYHQSEVLASATAEAVRELGVPVELLPADLSRPEEVDDLFARVAALPNPLRVLVNSAAVMPRGDLRDMAVDDWDATLNLNLRAPWLCARAAARLMADSGGLVVNITDSGAGKVWTGFPAYILSKSALETLTRLLARALAPTVRVNGVAPGLILPADDLPPEQWQKLVDRLPLQASGQPEDVARAVTFFLHNPYVTGQIIAVDGGYNLI